MFCDIHIHINNGVLDLNATLHAEINYGLLASYNDRFVLEHYLYKAR